MATNEPDRQGRLELIVESNSRAIQALTSAIADNSRAIADNSRAIADTNNAVAATRALVDGLAQIIAEYSARTESRLNSLEQLLISSQARLSIAESRLDRLDNTEL